MNCQTRQEFVYKFTDSNANLLKIYVNNENSEEHYLQNWKWLMKGDTIFNYYNNNCKPNRRIFLLLER